MPGQTGASHTHHKTPIPTAQVALLGLRVRLGGCRELPPTLTRTRVRGPSREATSAHTVLAVRVTEPAELKTIPVPWATNRDVICRRALGHDSAPRPIHFA